ncbi:MAG TPA: ParB/RepB/Spo0J family partition protein [Planctomycetota bacterium]|nr:ParB/RepB/Spo0J family partition protein [Planctomycetota bacterium]
MNPKQPTRRLGMGLDALFGPIEADADPKGGVSEIELSKIRTNPFQPRSEFDPAEIEALAASIRESGLLQPVVVRPKDGRYELVAGERRMRAATAAGLKRIPAVVKELDDAAMLKMALVENIQRQDLNALEKAVAFRSLMQTFGYTQEKVAKELGMDRTTVANFVRLLELPAEIREAVGKGLITQGHARALLACPSAAEQAKLLRAIIKEELSVRETERRVYGKKKPAAPAASGGRAVPPLIRDLEEKFTGLLGTKVSIRPGRKGGKIIVEYYSNDHLTGLMDQLGIAA